jgi:hypothetical protein
VRPVLALLGGIAISIIGLSIVLDTAWELVGVALIVGGVAVAAQVTSPRATGRLRGAMRGVGAGTGRSSIVGRPSGLGTRLARRGSTPPKGD